MEETPGFAVVDYVLNESDHAAFAVWSALTSGFWARSVRTARVLIGLAVAACLAGIACALVPPTETDFVPIRTARAALIAAVVGFALGRAVSRRPAEALVVRFLHHRMRRHRSMLDAEDNPRRLWVDALGMGAITHTVSVHCDWASLQEVASTGDHWIIRIRHPRWISGMILPRRFGPAAERVAEGLRAGVSAHAADTTPPSFVPRPEAVNFVLTVSEHREQAAWDSARGAYAFLVRERRLGELASMLAFVPVLIVLWLPAWYEYEWTALLPAVAASTAVIGGSIWVWCSAPRRVLVQQMQAVEDDCRRDSTDERGPTSVWLDRDGVNVHHLTRQYHYAWSRITEVCETDRLVLFAADGKTVTLPRRADPQRVAWLGAALQSKVAANGQDPGWRRSRARIGL